MKVTFPQVEHSLQQICCWQIDWRHIFLLQNLISSGLKNLCKKLSGFMNLLDEQSEKKYSVSQSVSLEARYIVTTALDIADWNFEFMFFY